MRNYVDSCRTYEILLQDSGVLPRPNEEWNVFEPKIGDIAHVDENEKDYVWDGIKWVEYMEEVEEN